MSSYDIVKGRHYICLPTEISRYVLGDCIAYVKTKISLGADISIERRWKSSDASSTGSASRERFVLQTGRILCPGPSRGGNGWSPESIILFFTRKPRKRIFYQSRYSPIP